MWQRGWRDRAWSDLGNPWDIIIVGGGITGAGIHKLCPSLTSANLSGGFRYFDAQTDDARLVLRLLREGVRDGAAQNRSVVLNYARAETLLRLRSGRVGGVAVRDLAPDGRQRHQEVKARVVVNATGAWADTLRGQLGHSPRLRRLHGSHLVFPAARLPLSRAVSFAHPRDQRPVFALPWEGVTLFGTTKHCRQHRSLGRIALGRPL